MSDGEHDRLWMRLNDHETRIRVIEQGETPAGRDLREVQRRVSDMDIHGTTVTQVRLKNIEDDVKEIREDAKALRITIRSALITAAASILVQVVLFLILRST